MTKVRRTTKCDAKDAVGGPNSATRRQTISTHVLAFGKPFRALFAASYGAPWPSVRRRLLGTDADSCLEALGWAAKQLGAVTHKIEHF